MDAHVERADIVKKNHPAQAVGKGSGEQQGSHHGIVTPWFVYHRTAEMIVLLAENGRLIRDAAATQVRCSRNHHPRGFTSCMGINGSNWRLVVRHADRLMTSACLAIRKTTASFSQSQVCHHPEMGEMSMTRGTFSNGILACVLSGRKSAGHSG
jgi:hypothetical protein